jgi:hypothetical protein
MEKKIKILEKKNKILEKKTKTITINNNINNVVNINLIGYGKEDLTKIDKKDMIKIMKNGFKSSLRLTEALHFNEKLPEYHNIYISNIKDKYAMIYNGKDWNLITKDELIDQIYDDKRNYIEENIPTFIESITESQTRALHRWLNTDEDDKKIKIIKEEIKLLLYNSRNLALQYKES